MKRVLLYYIGQGRDYKFIEFGRYLHVFIYILDIQISSKKISFYTSQFAQFVIFLVGICVHTPASTTCAHPNSHVHLALLSHTTHTHVR
jgi:hypothetical protein